MRNQSLIYCLLIISLFGYGCVTAKKVDTVKLGDNNMSCDQLFEEINKLEAHREKEKQNSEKANIAGGAALGAMALAPFTFGASLFVGPALGAGMIAAKGSGEESEYSAESAHARAQYLSGIFNQKNCKIPNIDIDQSQANNIDKSQLEEGKAQQ